MKCHVLYFAALAEQIGRRDDTIDLADGSRITDVLRAIVEQHQHARPFLEAVAVAMDEQYVSRDTKVIEGCTLALIPPVSGG